MVLADCDVHLGVLVAIRPDRFLTLCLANGVGNSTVVNGRARWDSVPIFVEDCEDDLRTGKIEWENAPSSVIVIFAFHVAMIDPVYMKRRMPAAEV
jgi:hypothetical protein